MNKHRIFVFISRTTNFTYFINETLRTVGGDTDGSSYYILENLKHVFNVECVVVPRNIIDVSLIEDVDEEEVEGYAFFDFDESSPYHQNFVAALFNTVDVYDALMVASA